MHMNTDVALAERPLAEQLIRLRKLYELSMTLAGDPMEVFRHVARMIGELLEVKVVCLSEVRGSELHFLAVYANGRIFSDAGHCPLAITPCATVEASKDFRIYEEVQTLFPEAKFLAQHDAFSYCGFPALDNHGRVIAITCLLDDKPHAFTADDEAVLRVFGQRIGMEIERHRHLRAEQEASEKLRQYRDQLEQLVEARTAQLTAANKELEAFSCSVSHDLRGPLRAIDGFIRIVLEDHAVQLDTAARGHLERARYSAQNMGALIDGLLELSRVGRAELTPTEIDVSAMAAEIMDQLRAVESGRQVEVRIAPSLTARADARLLHVVLTNLLGNSWKYTARTEHARIEFDAIEENGETVYRICDNGAGFDVRYIGKLFGAFQRLHRDDDFPGTGIGLATVARIIDRHGGRVWAQGEVGKGATFFYTVPPTNVVDGVERPMP